MPGLVGVVEDDPVIRRIVAESLRLGGYQVLAATTGLQATQAFGTDSGVEVLVVDIGLPDLDGRTVCAQLRSVGQEAPVLFLTALDARADRLAAFAAGADDFLPKPFEVAELVARVGALWRRRPGASIAVPGLSVDPSSHVARSNQGETLLTPTEYRVLAVLIAAGDGQVTRTSVVDAGWPGRAPIAGNTVDSYLRRIRVKLEAIDSPMGIETIRGVGYRLRPLVR